jgi:outer membrane immunogenic protein
MKTVTAALAFAAFAAPAVAADLPVKAPVRTVVPTVHTWTGCYIGGNVGVGWGRENWGFRDPPNIVDFGSHNLNGAIAGGQVGCDFQAGPTVFGVEGMFDWTNIKGSHSFVTQFQEDMTTRIHWLATATGRVGYSFDRALLYVKGGGAWVRDRHDHSSPAVAPFGGTASVTRSGWTVGGGLEYAITANWSVKAEYSYVDFGTRTTTICNPNPCTFQFDIRQNIQWVLLGLNYRFGIPGAVTARY